MTPKSLQKIALSCSELERAFSSARGETQEIETIRKNLIRLAKRTRHDATAALQALGG